MPIASTEPEPFPGGQPGAAGAQEALPAPAGPLAAAAAPKGIEPRPVAVSMIAIVLGLVASVVLNEVTNPPALTIPAGISVFALFYAVTQSMERLLEPFASLWDTTLPYMKARDESLAMAQNMRASGEPAAAQEHLGTAAAHQATIDQQRSNRAVIYWAAASVLGLLLAGVLGLYLLHVVGLRDDLVGPDGRLAGSWWSAAGVRHVLDLLVTGLAIGGGTKPLHDVIQNLQEAKNGRKDPTQVAG